MLVLFGSALDTEAQDDPTGQDRVLLRGRVIDEQTRSPIEGAIVMPIGSLSGYMTDSLGLWVLEVDPSRFGYPISVEQLGYSHVEATLAPTAPEEFTTVKLPPNPVALEGLQVLVDRFERRRRFSYGSVRVLDQARLLRSGGSAYDLVRREVPFARPCPADSNKLCAMRRGRRITVSLCIDEVPAWGGAAELDTYDPSELYLVEIYGRGQQVRVYTRWFVEQAMRRGRTLQPLVWGCA
mgnify:CR=1 FL=1